MIESQQKEIGELKAMVEKLIADDKTSASVQK